MRKKEAAFQTKFNHWVRTQFKKTAAFELKQCDTSLPFSRVEEHQINALLTARHRTLVYKIPDDTRSYKPFDCFALSGVESFVVVLYTDTHNFYGIPIDLFLKARDTMVRKSLRESDAKAIASFHGSTGKEM